LIGEFARTAAGAILISLPGAAALRRDPPASSRAARWALAFPLGLALSVPAGFAAALFGVPLRGRVIAAICVVLALALSLARKRSRVPPGGDRRPLSRAAIATRALLALAAGLFLAKVALVPVWSWDYYAVHGTKARTMFDDQILDLGRLQLPGLAISHPDYAIGGPVAWRLLALGAVPGERSVKLAHALFALALLALVRGGILAAGRSEAAANTGAAFAAISPLFWDTESLGLMEVPFALFLAASFLLLLEMRRGDPLRGGWIWGAIAGFLPWIKLREGVSLVLLLAGAQLLFRVRRHEPLSRRLAPAAFALAGTAAAGFVSIFLLPPGEKFLVGNWVSRGLERAAHPVPIVSLLARELLAPEWFGFWVVFAAAWVYSIVRRRPTAAVLTSVIAAQIAVYASVYFFTYLDPADHIRSSFFRISAALLPAALIALAPAEAARLRTP
jgi:hypothetical protein